MAVEQTGGNRDSLARRKLLGVLSGSWLAQGVYALVKLGVPELLKDGPRPATELAHACDADPLALERLLRALALSGLFTQPTPGTFGLTAASELLRPDVPGSVHLNALMQGEEVFRSFAEIMHTMRTGRPAFEQVYGQPFYAYLEDNPAAAHVFNESMGDQPPPAGLTPDDLAEVTTIVDIGGGNGSLLASLLADAPHRRGVLLDLTDAVRQARRRLAGTGLETRIEFIAGSFFDIVPAGCDAYLLCRVLHNWTDERALEILRRAHAAMAPHARLFVLEEFLPEDGRGRAGAGLVDLLMLVTLEGRDRTEHEYRDLLVKAGFEVTAARPGVLEARAI